MEQQTAVEWLVEQLPEILQEGLKYVIEDAKQIEKQQIIKSRENGISEGYRRTNNFYYDKMVDSKQYYNKTFKQD